MDFAKFKDRGVNLIKKQSPETIAIIIGALILVLVIVYWVGKMKGNLFESNNRRLDYIYPGFPHIRGITKSNARHQYKLRDYYVKTAYNCCASGNFKHDWVSTKALTTCIRQGARCLDFQVFSIDDRPVIAVSDNTDYSVKGSYNYIPFSKAMEVISRQAFAGSTCPCPGDPLILHFRIMTKNTPIMEIMADNISSIFTASKRTLGKEYSYESQGNNIGSTDLKELKGKVIIVVDKSHANPTKTKLDEYVNLTSNSAFMRTLRYDDVKYAPDMQELVDYNKKFMTMCIPNLGQKPENPSPALAHKYGCQFVAMSFQKWDNQMRYYDDFFNTEGSSFVLKPEELRYKEVRIEIPKPPPKEYSYKERKVDSDFYSFNI